MTGLTISVVTVGSVAPGEVLGQRIKSMSLCHLDSVSPSSISLQGGKEGALSDRWMDKFQMDKSEKF